MKKGLLFALSVLLFSATGYSQVTEGFTKKCGINESLELIYERYPELRKEHDHMQQLMENSLQLTGGSTKANDSTFVIPVVFHILHRYGNENINDAAVYSAMDHLNMEFAYNDPDSVNIEPIFKQLASQSAANIEFRLATLDPFGNCTNGIEHINTHETYVGDGFSQMGQWDRSRYLNIWVTASIGVGGAIAYSHVPEDTDGSLFWTDGIVAHQSVIGSSSTPTHEVGHWLNLSHVWGGTNEPEVSCGDDGVADTPQTAGNSGGCPTNYQNCDTIPEHVQNYMNYASCENFFTPGQVDRMYNALIGISGQRNNLWLDTTLLLTGTDSATYANYPNNIEICTPVADFNADDKYICVGANTTFEDHSWNAAIDSRVWTFEDGTPATSTNPTAIVTFNTPGWKEVTLEVTSAGGTDTRTESNYIYVMPDWAWYTGPNMLNIEGNQSQKFVVDNPEDNHGIFKAVDGVGMDQSRAFKLALYKDISQADPYTAEYFHNDRLGMTIDNLITPSFDLRYTSSVTVTFDYAYATNASQVDDIEEVLKVKSSTNCGENWATRKTINGSTLVTAGFAGNTDWAPTSNNQYGQASFSYTTTAADSRTRFMFEFTASDLASNLYIDNINVSGVLTIEPNEIADLELTVFPNPSKGEAINVQYIAQDEAVQFTLRDMSGKVISTETIETTNATVNHQLNGSSNLPAACYFLEVRSGDFSTTKKVVVL